MTEYVAIEVAFAKITAADRGRRKARVRYDESLRQWVEEGVPLPAGSIAPKSSAAEAYKHWLDVPLTSYTETYSYSYRHTEDLKPGTLVVVDSPNSGYTLCTVVPRKGSIDDSRATKWIVGVVDDADYQTRKVSEARAAELKSKLDARLKQLMELKKYELLRSDESAAEMIAELEALSKG